MLVNRKYRIYPTEEQKKTIMITFGCARVVYNACLDARNQHYEQWKNAGKPEGGFDNSLPKISELKSMMPWLAQSDSLALSCAKMNFISALNAFFDSLSGKRKGPKIHYPKHKKRGKSRFSYTTCNKGGNIRFDQEDKHIKLPKLGWVKVVKHRPLPDGGVIKRVYVSMTKAEEFYVSLNIECARRVPVINKVYNIKNPRVVGLDMSLPKFLVSSDPDDDAITKYVGQYRKEERRLARYQRQMSRKKPTRTEAIDGNEVTVEAPHHRKARLKYARHSGRVARCRREFCISVARYYAMKYDIICIEDVDMHAMAQGLKLGKSVMDLGWGMFRRWLEHECEKFDTALIKADKWYASSKTCNACGNRNKGLKLSDREWVCPKCGRVIDRDRNAACNLRDYALREICTAGTAGINACGDTASTLRGTVGRVVALKQEAAESSVQR